MSSFCIALSFKIRNMNKSVLNRSINIRLVPKITELYIESIQHVALSIKNLQFLKDSFILLNKRITSYKSEDSWESFWIGGKDP